MAGPQSLRGRAKRRLGAWFEQHARAALGALGRSRRSLAPSLMTAAVIGIALALPAAFLLLLDNVQAVAGGWQGQTRASLFLSGNVGEDAQRALAHRIAERDDVASVKVITPAQAMTEFRRNSGLEDALELLEDNPLPPVIVVQPAATLTPEAVDRVMDELQRQPQVERIRLDREWVRRLHAMLQLAQRGVWVITALLGLTVVLVVGNTIRLDIENRRAEIVITKLIGATDAFVRRPFLYSGLWYGAAGGLLSCIIVEGGRLLLGGPVDDLAALYGSAFRLQGVGFSGALTLLACGAMLGLLGSWMAVGRHLAAIEPQ
ncbi:MAG: permease-like cell division protein FtsX [Ectothiorhodospiraceae bacterium]|jgi:cell division transport system permease protein